ncbi:MAG: M15 family metallopeptidase [Clostridia bacterium]|nr:M15 family metallopeptidase [Clostridia bacterium]
MKKLPVWIALTALLALSAAYLALAEGAPGQTPEEIEDAPVPAEAKKEEVLAAAAAEAEAKTERGTEEGYLILVNRQHPVPEDYDPDIVTVPGRNVRGEKKAAEALRDMLSAGEKEGLRFVVCSGYRTREDQRRLYLNQIQRRLDGGMTQSEAVAEAEAVSALPGTSEHETGLAFDVVALSYQNLDEGYALTSEAAWLRAHAMEYGFILRYPPDKSGITGIAYEPWHYRYVGEKAAAEIAESGLALEEYVENTR